MEKVKVWALSLFSYITGLANELLAHGDTLTTVIPILAGAILSVLGGLADFRVKKAEARKLIAEAHRLEIENAGLELDNLRKNLDNNDTEKI